jgi:hypothetical protein
MKYNVVFTFEYEFDTKIGVADRDKMHNAGATALTEALYEIGMDSNLVNACSDVSTEEVV